MADFVASTLLGVRLYLWVSAVRWPAAGAVVRSLFEPARMETGSVAPSHIIVIELVRNN